VNCVSMNSALRMKRFLETAGARMAMRKGARLDSSGGERQRAHVGRVWGEEDSPDGGGLEKKGRDAEKDTKLSPTPTTPTFGDHVPPWTKIRYASNNSVRPGPW
jgi:hypothetical protein